MWEEATGSGRCTRILGCLIHEIPVPKSNHYVKQATQSCTVAMEVVLSGGQGWLDSYLMQQGRPLWR